MKPQKDGYLCITVAVYWPVTMGSFQIGVIHPDHDGLLRSRLPFSFPL